MKTKPQIIKLLIVDEFPIVREGIARALQSDPDMTVEGYSATPESALAQIEERKPDIVITELLFQNGTAISMIKQLNTRYPDLPLVVFTRCTDSYFAERAVRMGASGYVLKQTETTDLIQAIRKVLEGETYVSQELMERAPSKKIRTSPRVRWEPFERLSNRELEVFRLVGQGLSTRQIAKKLTLSVKTVETYREHIKAKLNLRNASELLQHAIPWANSESLS